MRFLLLTSSVSLWLAVTFAEAPKVAEISPNDSTTDLDKLKKLDNIDNVDNTYIDKNDIDNASIDKTHLATNNIDDAHTSNIDDFYDEGYESESESDWDFLKNSDEYAFTRETRSVTKVPKNTKASDDIFYLQPENIASYSPGDVIRMREVSPSAYPDNVKAIYQYMVRSTDSLDHPVGIVSTIYISNNADGKKLLSFQVPTDSPCIDCAPSVDMADSMKKLQKPFELGWNVIAPDFQGLHGAFGAARLAGQATLDSVRGALTTGNVTNIANDAKFAMWGYSGGSIATGWAAALQPQYAPELKDQLVGAAVGGWITNYDSTIKAADGNLAAGLVALALSGLAQQYPELVLIYRKYIRNAVRLRMVLEDTKRKCLTQGIILFAVSTFFTGINPYFKGGDKVLNEPRVREIIEENRVAQHRETGMPECPFFLHHAIKDNISPVQDTKRAVYKYCKWGIRSFEVNYARDSGHMSESRDGVPAVLAWLHDRFEGVDPVKGCTEKTWGSLREYPGVDKVYSRRDNLEVSGDEVGLEDDDFVRSILPLP